MGSTSAATNAMTRTSGMAMAAQATAKLSVDGNVSEAILRRETSALRSAAMVSILASFSVTMGILSVEMGKH
jgi:hypothetical protein